MRRLRQALAGLAVSAVALWLTLRGKDLGAIWQALQEGDYRWLAPYLLMGLAIHLVRTWRWGILLEPVAKVPFARLNAVAAVGFMALVLLPFRLGELARPYLVAERPRLRVSAALSSVVVERVADGLFMGLLLMVTLLGVPEGTPGLRVIRLGGVLVSLAFAALLAFLVLAYKNRALAVRLTARLLGPISPGLAARASGMVDAFIHGLRLVPSRRKLALFFALTAVYWALSGFSMQVLARGFGIELGAVDTFTVLGVLVIGVMIPAGPGMVGTFQGAVVVGLSLFVPREVAATHGVAYANVLWAAQIGLQALLGAVFLFSRHVQLGRIFSAPAETGEALAEEEAEYQATSSSLSPTEPTRGEGRDEGAST
ncbi:MAG TPA: lysylphosphatidylglycerol synthase transmembrane domain-containing protein [Anaeromyxobacteraceae bacterium]|nr:lysylphosphatidylglycerol synthase transmembrane domain-containing protein [Anaeromyxobacteraceae bacterium]